VVFSTQREATLKLSNTLPQLRNDYTKSKR